jgi:hypothetical protein
MSRIAFFDRFTKWLGQGKAVENASFMVKACYPPPIPIPIPIPRPAARMPAGAFRRTFGLAARL